MILLRGRIIKRWLAWVTSLAVEWLRAWRWPGGV